VDVSATRLLDWLRRAHPEWSAVAIGSLVPSAAGYSNVTLLGSLQWREAGYPRQQDFVLRLQPATDSIYPDHDVMRQCRVLRALAGTGLPVPELLGVEHDPSVLGSPFYLMRRIDGLAPNEDPLYHLEGWFHDLPAYLQRRCWLAGIEAVGRMSRLDWRRLELGFLVDGAGLSRQLDYYARAILWAEQLAGRRYPLLHAAEAWLRAKQPDEERLAFSWGDAKLGNCLFRDGELVGVLDFEQATLSSPVDDLAWWLMLDDSLSRGYGVPRLAGLPSRSVSIAAWERASGERAINLDYYEVYAAWRMAFVMARLAHIFRSRGWISPEDDMDVRNGGAALLAAHGEREGFA
jgi:aminoglycoside phosphotransferase (APT) family kinase protein